MKKKQFLNGTGLGSKIEPDTKSSSAPRSAATEVVELDDDSLASVSGGATLAWVFRGSSRLLDLYTRSGSDLRYRASLTFACAGDADAAERALVGLERSDVSASDIINTLANAGITALDGDSLTW